MFFITGYDVGSSYESDSYCTWKIIAPEGELVDIWFDNPFHLEAGESLCYDTLTIFRKYYYCYPILFLKNYVSKVSINVALF